MYGSCPNGVLQLQIIICGKHISRRRIVTVCINNTYSSNTIIEKIKL